jgi:hypothetical protein
MLFPSINDKPLAKRIRLPYPILHPFIPDRNGNLRYFGPDSGTHAEEIKIESTADEQEDKPISPDIFAAFKSAARPAPSHSLRAHWDRYFLVY